MEKQQDKIAFSFQELLFYGYFGLMLLVKGLGYADGSVYKAGCLLALVLAVGKIFTTSYTAMEWGMVVILSGLAVINYMVTRLESMLFVIPLILSMKNVPVKRVMHLGAIGWSVTFFFQVFTHLTRLRSFDFVIHNKFGLGYVIRWAMGYVHPNVLQIAYDVLVFHLVYSCCSNRRSFHKAFWLSLAGAVYFFFYSLSVTGMVMFAAFWFFLGMEYWLPKKSVIPEKIRMTMTMLLLPAEVMLALMLPFLLKGRAFDIFEKLMTHRPLLTRFFFTTYGLSWFGNNPSGLTPEYTLDSSYANLLFHGGIVLFVIAMVGYVLLVHQEWKMFSGNRTAETGVELAITLVCLFGAVSEPFAFNTSFKNVSLIFMGNFLFAGSKDKREYSLLPFLQTWLHQKKWDVFYGFNFWSALKFAENALSRKSRNNAGKAAFVGMIFLMVGTYTYLKTADHVEKYYCLWANAGVDYEESFILSETDAVMLAKDPSVRILSYKDSDTPMVCFEGTIGRVEFVRGLLSTAIWSFIAVGAIVIALPERGRSKR